MTRSRWNSPILTVWTAIGLMAAVLGFAALPARADEFVDRANAAVRKAADDRRSDLILLPLLPALQPPPSVYTSQYQAALYGSHGPGWSDAKAWAEGESQKKILEALVTVTKNENDPQKGFVFGLPYGADAAGPDLVTIGMFADLGDPPMLAALRLPYLEKLETVGILMHIEASRLAESGDSLGALERMKQWLFFARQMADRPFLKEKKWGMESILLAFERASDIAYVDFRAEKHNLEPAKLRDLINLARERALYIDRIQLPEGDFIAREQLISLIFHERGGPKADTFGPTMARIAATDRPLRLFSAVAYWNNAAARHADWLDTKNRLSGLKVDWQRRWSLPAFDPVQSTKGVWTLRVANNPRYAVIHSGLSEFPALFTLRRRIEAFQAGTRMSLAAYGFFLREGVIPRNLASVVPSFVRALEKDPYSPRNRDIQFLRPDLQAPKDRFGQPIPFEVKLFPAPPRPELRQVIDKSQFIIYSVGPDDKDEGALECTQGQEGKSGDYLFWPPELSLERQRLIDDGQLK